MEHGKSIARICSPILKQREFHAKYRVVDMREEIFEQ